MGACDGSALLQWHEIRRQTRLRRTAGFRRRGSRMGSQLELHPIIGDFPPGFTHSAILRALFIQHRIGIVDVDDDPLSLSETKRPLQQATLAPERKVSHRTGGFERARTRNKLFSSVRMRRTDRVE